jgi:hypothetical protein
MKTNISEELPARKHAPAAPANGAKKAAPSAKKEGGGSTAENSEKRIRQAVYDIRYRARREDIDLKQAFSQYMSNSSLNPAERKAVKDKLFGKKVGVTESHFVDSVDWAVDSVAGALYRVFVEGVQKEEVINLEYENQLAEETDRKYKIRVTDPKSGKSYVRYATREKITALRGRGLKVEMTEYGEPYEGERKKKKKDIPNNKSGLDKPVHPSKRDGDVNDDGKKDNTDSYIYNRRDAIRRAMNKEDYLWFEGTTSTDGKNRVPAAIDVGVKVDNSKRITVFPDDGSNPQNNGGVISAGNEMEGPFLIEKAKSKAQQRFMGMVYARKKGEMKKGEASPEVEAAAKGMTKKEAKKYAKTKHKGLPENVKEENSKACECCGENPCDCKEKRTYRELLKNKFRAMGIKNPIMLDAPTDGKEVMKIMTSSSAKMNSEGYDSRYGRGERGEPKKTENLELSPEAQKKYDAMMKELKAKSNLKGV